MLAWRIVQPVIFDFFFYQDKRFGIFTLRHDMPNLRAEELEHIKDLITDADLKLDPTTSSEEDRRLARQALAEQKLAAVIDNLKRYPWHDSDALLSGLQFETWLENKKLPPKTGRFAQFHPGSYLSKQMHLLYFVIGICLLILTISVWQVVDRNGFKSTGILSIIFSIGFSAYTLISCRNFWLRSRLLESGLLSIQTSAFIWRVVCLAHLCAIRHLQHPNTISRPKHQSKPAQLYQNYTRQLALVACELRGRLHEIHDWLADAEDFLNSPKPQGR